MNISERLAWVDFLKILAMFLVIIGHIGADSELNRIIYFFHMPLFFVVCGYLYKKRPVKSELLRSFSCLIVPYFCWSLLFILLMCFFRQDRLYDAIIGMFAMENKNEIYVPPIGSFWFVIALFWQRLFASLASRKWLLVFSFVIIVVLQILLFFNIHIGNTIFSIDSALIGFPFFLFGSLLQDCSLKTGLNKTNLYDIFIFLLCFLLIFILSKTYYCDISNGYYGGNSFVYYSTNFLFIFFLMKVFSRFSFCSVISENMKIYNEGMIFILAIHCKIAIPMFDYFLSHYSLSREYKVFLAFIIAFFTMSILYLPIKFIVRYVPFIIGKK